MHTRSYAYLFAALAAGTVRGQDLRSDTADNLNATGAWTDGSVPTAADIATWNATSALANTLGAAQSFGGLDLSGAAGPVSISGAFNLGLDHSTDASTILDTGANDFTWGQTGSGGAFNIIGALSAAPGNGNTGTGATFAGSGITTLSGTGTKNWSTSGNATNGANGVTNVTFTGTLRLRGATTPIESLAGNWLAFGGGGGTTDLPGSLTQTGAFHLDTGDDESRGDFILTQAFNGQALELASLSGTGNIRSDWGVGAALSERAIHIDQDIDTVYAGGIYTHNGSGQRRDVTLTKDGSGKLTFIGRLGSTQGGGGNPASLNFAINGGVWQMGDGSENPSAPLNAGNWDSASTFTIGSAGTLRFMANENEYAWDRVLDGDGLLEITSDGTPGEGKVALTAHSPDFTGPTHVLGGQLRFGGDLYNSPVTVADGAGIAIGSSGASGTGIVKSIAFSGSTTSTFRAGGGIDSDLLIIDDPDGFTVSGPHVLTAVSTGGLNPGEQVPVIDYNGSFTGFANLSLAPGSRFTLVHNTADTSVDLLYSGGTITWAGGTGVWDLDTTANWELDGSPTPFLTGDAARFDDSASTGNVVLAGDQNPSALLIDNDTLAYTLSGDTLGGNGDFTKQGPGTATVTTPTSYSGYTYVDEGLLTFGDGASSGEVGSGPVDLLPGATLRIHRNDLLDYKADPRLRTVSGGGDVVIDGGCLLFNYTGGGTAFSSPGTWSAFTGNLVIKGDSEFQTIRNGANAMGTGSIVLGDATTSGALSQIEGNWTFTNDIEVTGPDNLIVNRSAGSNRTMKLQGILSGSGSLTFLDATSAMGNLQTGFILTGDNTLDGTLAISAGVPVRVGGIPGETDTNQSGADASGSLGAATVINDGHLTFSRTDSHAVDNDISGSGEVIIGLNSGTDTQEVTFTGSKTYSGATLVRNGTLRLDTTLPGSPVVVETAGTLAGSGSLGSGLTIDGTLAPGNSVGTLTSSDDIALSNGATIAWEISDWDGSAGSGYDTINTATLTIDAVAGTPVVVRITGDSLANFSESPRTFTLVSTSGGISGLDAGEIVVDATNAPGSGSWSVQANGNALELAYSLGNAYDSFETANGIAGAGADTDSDGDGIANGIEFVIGGDPSGPGSDSNALLLPATVDVTSLTYVFRRSDASAPFNPGVEYSPDLDQWTSATDGVDGINITVEDDFYPGNIDRVSVVIPRALGTGSALYARLRVSIP
ncbi:beta strand repeat-containing protein [Luteolibacter marinus]|uniref:beta strand repeat-containing protein n=1 Tax=Luteolibacter marinus TaxID=2776705 RepID=UPI001866E8E9|nr:hypothetical protein [Luteolibacter marinus]